jgi:formylglycine-generating enzyme required for sulfatase activity
MGSNPSAFEGDNLPVENVNWDDCQTFISKLNNATGKRFRLPTEAEWEYAARGGNKSRGYKYSGSNDLGSVAWYTNNSGSKTHDVKTKQPNELNIYDMTGSVQEWCQDWYGDYSRASQTNPTGPSSGSGRVYRGGSWYSNPVWSRISSRNSYEPKVHREWVGFRLAQ